MLKRSSIMSCQLTSAQVGKSPGKSSREERVACASVQECPLKMARGRVYYQPSALRLRTPSLPACRPRLTVQAIRVRQYSGMSPETVLQKRLARPTLHIEMPTPSGRTLATVEWWSDEEGWGALTSSEEMPGGAFVHFSAIQTDPMEYRTLRPGQKVDAVIEGPLSYDQDGYRYRATEVWPVD
jgi:cold shock CspA family protein